MSQPATESPPGDRIPSLDGLRGLSILLVLFGHGMESIGVPPTPLAGLFGNGLLGVEVFFVLSGFLIHHLSAREIARTGRFDWKRFYLRRVLRIFPCFYLFIAVVMVLRAAGLLSIPGPMMASAATFTQNYQHLWLGGMDSGDYFVIGHYWTLSLEEQFYLVWPLLMALLVRGRLAKAMLGVVVLVPLVRVASYYGVPGSRPRMGMMFHTGCDAIAAGVLLGEVLRGGRAADLLRSVASRPWAVWTAAFLLFVVSGLVFQRFQGAYLFTVGRTLEVACLAVLVTAAISFRDTLLFRVLNWRPLAFVGVLSYSLYVWNNLFLYTSKGWPVHRFPLNFACVFAAALASHYLVERPFLRLKDRLRRAVPANA